MLVVGLTLQYFHLHRMLVVGFTLQYFHLHHCRLLFLCCVRPPVSFAHVTPPFHHALRSLRLATRRPHPRPKLPAVLLATGGSHVETRRARSIHTRSIALAQWQPRLARCARNGG